MTPIKTRAEVLTAVKTQAEVMAAMQTEAEVTAQATMKTEAEVTAHQGRAGVTAHIKGRAEVPPQGIFLHVLRAIVAMAGG